MHNRLFSNHTSIAAPNAARPLSRLALGLCAALLITACTTTEPVYYPDPNIPTGPVSPVDPIDTDVEEQDPEDTQEDMGNQPPEQIVTRNGITPPHMVGRDIKRMALLLPFSASSPRLREEADSMLKAAQMAVFDRNAADTLLLAFDTTGTAQGTRTAVQAAVKSGVDVILGPILSGSVAAAGREARISKTPVIAFSTDQTVAGNGTYLLSFPPEAEIERIVEFMRGTGAERFAFLGPNSEYGRRVKAQYLKSVTESGGEVTASETYSGNDISVMDAPARKLAEQYGRVEARAGRTGRQAFDAILLPEGGTALRSLAPLLPYYEDGISNVQFLGTGLWHREDTVREPALNGGVFAGPDEQARERFVEGYDQVFDAEPSQLASLAYDAVNLGLVVADGDPKGRKARAEDPQGFYGADGLVQFNADGIPHRGLAIYQIQNGRFVIIDPAPRTALGVN